MKTPLLLIASLALTATVAMAQTKPAEAPKTEPRSSDKVDLKKLEDKYWSQKDEDYSVIQNRLYSKSGKLYFSGTTGTLMNDPFAQAKPFGANIGYYFNEDFGIEASYIGGNAKASASVSEFKSAVAGASPNYNIPTGSMALSAVYTPFYAKLAFMNWAIMYFDMGLTAGVGTSQYDQIVLQNGSESKVSKSAPHFEIGVMQQLFLSKNFAFRLDIKNSFYNEELVPYDSSSPTAIPGKTVMKNNTYLMFGITLFTN